MKKSPTPGALQCVCAVTMKWDLRSNQRLVTAGIDGQYDIMKYNPTSQFLEKISVDLHDQNNGRPIHCTIHTEEEPDARTPGALQCVCAVTM